MNHANEESRTDVHLPMSHTDGIVVGELMLITHLLAQGHLLAQSHLLETVGLAEISRRLLQISSTERDLVRCFICWHRSAAA